MSFQNWPKSQMEFGDGKLLLICQSTATSIAGVPALIFTPSPDLLEKAFERLKIEWSPMAHETVFVSIAKEEMLRKIQKGGSLPQPTDIEILIP